jgi:signal transduction histidine kinase
VPDVAADVLAAAAGAVAEALTNAAKHGGGTRATVYAEPGDDGGVFVSVKDDGRGFDPATTTAGMGTTTSIRGRVADVGGRVDVDGNPGHGTEVRLWLPAS